MTYYIIVDMPAGGSVELPVCRATFARYRKKYACEYSELLPTWRAVVLNAAELSARLLNAAKRRY